MNTVYQNSNMIVKVNLSTNEVFVTNLKCNTNPTVKVELSMAGSKVTGSNITGKANSANYGGGEVFS